jgi:transposase InsO family protein
MFIRVRGILAIAKPPIAQGARMNLHRLARSCPSSRELLVERIAAGWSVAKAAHAAGVSDRTAFKWLRRHREEGVVGLADRSSRPRRCPGKTEAQREAVVLELRALRLTGPVIAHRLRMPRATVSRILRRHGQARLRSLQPPEPPKRYEYSKPGGLIHIDVKKLGRIGRPGHRVNGDRTTRMRGIGWEFVHVCVDDATRLAYVEVLHDERAETAIGFLRRAVAWYGRRGIKVQRLMTDNGPCYLAHDHRAACAELGLRHIRTRPYRPQTNGKAERFIQTLLREWAYAASYDTSACRAAALRPWLRYYNQRRPHMALDAQTPVTRLNNLVSLHS